MIRVDSFPSIWVCAALILLGSTSCNCFIQQTSKPTSHTGISPPRADFCTPSTATKGRPQYQSNLRNTISSSRRGHAGTASTTLNVWWFGGGALDEHLDHDESCELVAVRIERTSPNSRRIAGEITVEAPLDDVWRIITDYDRLAVHVPNLVESRIVRENGGGVPGDGTYRCRLFQVGAQKIIGFDFSASVTMDMAEVVVAPPEARKINFKCVDSQFFSEFDGSWTVRELRNPSTGEVETLCSYVVDVRPKGPVPVAALEWRIREDVPTNLRAVKAATLGRNRRSNALPQRMVTSAASRASLSSERSQTGDIPLQLATSSSSNAMASGRLSALMVDWDRDETMAKYL
jgi:Polyketide cyclase / dehydrase and lipid transport